MSLWSKIGFALALAMIAGGFVWQIYLHDTLPQAPDRARVHAIRAGKGPIRFGTDQEYNYGETAEWVIRGGYAGLLLVFGWNLRQRTLASIPRV